MVLYDAKDNQYIASKVKRPRLYSPLRCWDFERRGLDGDPIEMYLERGWGKAFYFEVDGQWYRLPFYKHPTDPFEVANFFTAKSKEVARVEAGAGV